MIGFPPPETRQLSLKHMTSAEVLGVIPFSKARGRDDSFCGCYMDTYPSMSTRPSTNTSNSNSPDLRSPTQEYRRMQELEAEASDAMFVILSNVHLDQPQVSISTHSHSLILSCKVIVSGIKHANSTGFEKIASPFPRLRSCPANAVCAHRELSFKTLRPWSAAIACAHAYISVYKCTDARRTRRREAHAKSI